MDENGFFLGMHFYNWHSFIIKNKNVHTCIYTRIYVCSQNNIYETIRYATIKETKIVTYNV